MLNLLIIGSEGSIGKYLSKFFKKKYKIFKIDKFSKNPNNINYKNIDLSKKKINNIKFNEKIDLVVCLSFNLNFKNISKKEYFDEGRNIFHNTLEIIKKNNIKIIQYFSSFAVYGKSLKLNKEDDISKPTTNYGKLKLECENKLIKFSTKKNLQYQIFRIPNVYGPQIKSSIIYKIYQNKNKKNPIILNNKGSSIRNFIHINDLANLNLKAFNSNNSGIFNVTAKNNYSILQIAKILKVKYILNKKNIEEPKKIIGSSLKARKKFKWIALRDIKNYKL
jgi:UDP-glucose 4-epimerase